MAQLDLGLTTWTQIFQSEASDLRPEDIWHLEFDNSIVAKNPQLGWKEYIRNTMGRFKCTHCGRTWPSNQVKVVFHMRLVHNMGTVKLRPYRQNCKTCHNAPMVNPSISSENIAILMMNLVKKIRIKCYHEDLGEATPYFERVEVNNPHEPDHCEGCQQGICARQNMM